MKKDVTKESFERSTAVYNRSDLTEDEKSIIKKYFKGKKILDLGCGAGRTTINLHKKGFKVIGIDYAKNLIKKAKENYPFIDFRVMDASNLKFKDSSFDVVFFSYNGIDYLNSYEKRLKSIKEAYRVLKKGGVFIYSSHKKFYPRFPLQLKFPFLRIHYLRTMLASLFAFNNYRWEKHQFGWLKTYCRNDSSNEPKEAGFKKVLRIDKGHNCYYICYKK